MVRIPEILGAHVHTTAREIYPGIQIGIEIEIERERTNETLSISKGTMGEPGGSSDFSPPHTVAEATVPVHNADSPERPHQRRKHREQRATRAA